MALTEFPRLLDSGFYDQTLEILTGPGWQSRNLLLPRLKNVPAYNREIFARMLSSNGYQADIPGIAPTEPRPWR